MKIRDILLPLCALVLTCSCSTIKHTADTVSVESKVVTFTVADLNVSPQRAAMTYSWGWNPFVRPSVSDIKTNVEAQILDQAGADVLLEPQYIVEKRGFMRGGSVTVTGYPAKYTNFHKMTHEESEIVKNLPTESGKKKTKKFFFF